jgi:hypothetical protein
VLEVGDACGVVAAGSVELGDVSDVPDRGATRSLAELQEATATQANTRTSERFTPVHHCAGVGAV